MSLLTVKTIVKEIGNIVAVIAPLWPKFSGVISDQKIMSIMSTAIIMMIELKTWSYVPLLST